MSQIQTRFITPSNIDDSLIRLRNNNYLRSRNAADSGDVNILRVNTSDRIEFPTAPQTSATPSVANDLTNKTYVDSAITSAINNQDFKASAQVVTTTNITLSGEQTIDGVTTSASRVLVTGQTTGANNGLYLTASGAWSRTTDADANSEVTAGFNVWVTEGTTFADTYWELTTNDPITVGSTTLTFSRLTSSIIAGNGLTLTGSTLDVVAGDTSIVSNADEVHVGLNTTGGLQTSSGLAIKPDTTTANTLAITTTSNGAGVKYDSASFSESSEALTLAAGVAGNGLSLTSGILAVNVDSVTTKLTGDAVVGQSNKKETFTLSGTNITNQYLDLTQVAATDSIIFMVQGSGYLLEGASYDYTVSYTGGVGSKTRVTFTNDLATGGAAALVAGDIVQINYMYL